VPDRYSGHKSPRDLTGVRGNQLIAEKRARDAHEAAQKKALADLAASGDDDLSALSEQHGGADVYVDAHTGVTVIDYSGTYR